MSLTDLLNFTDSQTADNLSDISLNLDSYTQSQNNQQVGGFFWSSTGCSKTDIAAVEAAKLKKYDVLEFLITKNLVGRYDCKDEDGSTILHYLVKDSTVKESLIDKVLSCSKVKSFINIQDNDKNTPLILAVKAGNHDLASKLISKGASKDIKNKDGFHVDTETDTPAGTSEPPGKQINKQNKDIFLKPKSETKTFTVNTLSPELSQAVAKTLDPIFQLMARARSKMNPGTPTSEPVTMELSRTEGQVPQASVTKTEGSSDFVKKLVNDYKVKDSSQIKHQNQNTSDILKDIESKSKNQSGGGEDGCGCGDTDKLTLKIEKALKLAQSGGKCSRTIGGKRRIPQYRESAAGKEDKADIDQLIARQSVNIHERTAEKIYKIMTENKKAFKDFDITQDSANAYKSLLWSIVKERNPEMKSNLDLSVELEKLATLDMLQSIPVEDVKARLKVIRDHADSKAKSKGKPPADTPVQVKDEPVKKVKNEPVKKNRKSKKDTTDTLSETSSEEVPSDLSVSDTSISMSTR